MKQIDYIKGKSNKGAIIQNGYAGSITYIAVTIATSKDFKTLKGAERYMTKFGYEVKEIKEIKEATKVKIEKRIAYLRVVR